MIYLKVWFINHIHINNIMIVSLSCTLGKNDIFVIILSENSIKHFFLVSLFLLSLFLLSFCFFMCRPLFDNFKLKHLFLIVLQILAISVMSTFYFWLIFIIGHLTYNLTVLSFENCWNTWKITNKPDNKQKKECIKRIAVT
jgi:hypothetical protein